MATISLMKAAIAKVYPGEKWQKRVSNMGDAQVMAVYNRMLYSGKLK